jgi:hypothetical protein
MARLRTNVLKGGGKDEGPNDYKHGRRGALDDAFWDEDELVDYVRQKRGKPKKPKAKGCSENNGKGHVYVWVPYHSCWWPDGKYEIKVCCGCLKRAQRKSFRRI